MPFSSREWGLPIAAVELAWLLLKDSIVFHLTSLTTIGERRGR